MIFVVASNIKFFNIKFEALRSRMEIVSSVHVESNIQAIFWV